MTKKIPVYCVDGKDSDVYDISLVEYPAIESDFVYFNKQDEAKKLVCLESNEKYMVCGAVLIPDKNIYRVDSEGFEYYIRFSAESIAEIAHAHLKSYKNNNFSTDHLEYVNSVYLYESWIAENENDKAFTKYGLDCPVGSWIILCKIDSVEIWERIKNNELAGFSIEGILGFNEVYEEIENKLKKEYTMTKEETKGFLDEIKDIIKETLSAFKSENVQMEEEVKTEVKDEEVIETKTEEVTEEVQMEEQTEVTQEQSEDTVTELEAQTEETVTSEEVQEQSVTEEVKMEEEVQTEAAPEDGEKVEQREEIETLRAEIETLKQQLNEANEKIVEMSKEPSAKPITRGEATNNFSSTMEQLKQLSKMQPK